MEAVARKIVTKIEPNPLLIKHRDDNALLRVAAYCRVSTDSNDQLESYKAQVAHYTEAISKNPKWRFVEIYADEGITGTSVKKRDSFKKMIKDCSKGKIDLILTKSVARFARNTLDSLKYVRQLKAQGVGVFFEEQNLDSLKADSEMFIGLHSVLAQAESENISANVRWGIQQRMRSGTFAFRYNILGYRKGDNGEPEIVESEAEVVRLIYKKFLDGCSLENIRLHLESKGILTAHGKQSWHPSMVQRILCNERYCGDLMLQKTYTESCITKKVKKNRGEMAKYFISNNHPAIISREEYKMVQMEMSRRSSARKVSTRTITEQGKYSGKYVLSDILMCGECGSPYRRKIWTYKGNRKIVWRCISRIDNGNEYCKESISIEEKALQKAIMQGISEAVKDKGELLDIALANLAYASTMDTKVLDVLSIEEQIKYNKGHIEQAVKDMNRTEGDKEKYKQAIAECTEQIKVLREQLVIIQASIKANEQTKLSIENIKQALSIDMLNTEEFDEPFIRKLVDHINVMKDNKIVIILKGGITIEKEIIS